MQKRCRTTIEFEPPPNEPTRIHEVGRVKRMGNPSKWIRHISLLAKDTFNTNQDSLSLLKIYLISRPSWISMFGAKRVTRITSLAITYCIPTSSIRSMTRRFVM